MGLFDRLLNVVKPDSELGWSLDLELFENAADKAYMKRLAIETCIAFLARTISQTEFKVRNKDKYLKDELYYKLNIRPSKNVTASSFWQQFVTKLTYDNEVLIIFTDDEDMLIADNFEHKEYAVFDDIFYDVSVKDYTFKRTFNQQEVIHLKFSNEKLSGLINSLYADYGELFARTLSSQKRKNQIRATVEMDIIAAKSARHQQELQNFIDNMYKSVENKDVALIPQQTGFKYNEHTKGSLPSQTADDLDRVTDAFLRQVAMVMGIPISLIHGTMADIVAQTKHYMFFTVEPLLKKLVDEMNVKFFTKQEFLNGECVEAMKPSYQSIFDLATAVDKLRASGIMNGHEIRSELGLERVENDMLDAFVITKNYQDGDQMKEEATASEGGEKQ